MARIPDSSLECVFYLYPSRAAAEAGEAVGGTGFFASVPSPAIDGGWRVYAVSNRHVVCTGGASVMRVNTEDGGVDYLDFEPHEWTAHPDGDDLAVIPMPADRDHLRVTSIPEANFVTKDFVNEIFIGPGDEVNMVGRFVNHEGRKRNTPAVRFGNISSLPHEPIRQQGGFQQESFLVEMRSHAGYSGSPVRIYRPQRVYTLDKESKFPKWLNAPSGYWLLGVDWGYITYDWEITRRPVRVLPASASTPIGDYVTANTGMSGVVPAWKLAELLHLPRFEEHWASVEKTGLVGRLATME